MLIQTVGISVLELPGAFALRGGLRLLHPWNTDSRTFGHAAAEAVPESRQHGCPINRPSVSQSLPYSRPGDFATANEYEERPSLPRSASPSRK